MRQPECRALTVHRIEAADPYSDDYEETVARNVREQDADARPEIADALGSIDRYDTILLASPIWNVRAPMIMSAFAERYDFSGKTERGDALGDGPRWRMPQHWTGDLDDVVAVTCAHQLEGIVFERLDSRYEPAGAAAHG